MAFTEEQIERHCRDHGWNRTGVFATPEEMQQARDWAAERYSAPVAKVMGRWLCDDADDLFKLRIDGLAKLHGLPDRGEDHYGMLATGEFTTEVGT